MLKLEDAMTGCNRILHGEFDKYSEQSLYMIGTIDEARRSRSSLHASKHKKHFANNEQYYPE